MELTEKNAPRSQIAVYAFILVAVGLALYSNTFHASFQDNDLATFVENSSLKEPFDLKSIWKVSDEHFFPHWTFSMNRWIFGSQVWGYHLVNILLHILASLVCFNLIRLSFETPSLKDLAAAQSRNTLALIGALYFLCHPIQTQAVTNLAQRSTLIATLCYLTSILYFVLFGLKEKWIFYFQSLGLAIAATFSHPSSYTIPFAVFIYSIVFIGGRPEKIGRGALLTLPFLCLVLFALQLGGGSGQTIFHPQEMPPTPYFSFLERPLLTGIASLRIYLELLLFPVNQNLEHALSIAKSFREPQALLSLMVGVSLLGLAWLNINRNKFIAFGILWFFLIWANRAFFASGGHPVKEHQLYLVMFGLANVVTGMIVLAIPYRKILLPLLILDIAICSAGTYDRNQIWQTEVSLWKDVVGKSPTNGLAHFHLANAYMQAWKPGDKSDETLKKAADHYQEAIRLKSPQEAEAFNGLAIALTFQGNFEEALVYYRYALKIKPRYAAAKRNIKLVTYLMQSLSEKEKEALLRKINFSYGASYLRNAPASNELSSD